MCVFQFWSPQSSCLGVGLLGHMVETLSVETVSDFIFLGSKITADGDCSHEIKRRLLLGRKVITNLDSMLKAETLLHQQWSSQGYGFSCGHVRM